MALINATAIPSADDFEIEQSLKLSESKTSYLTRTPTTASNRKTWTWSGWVKRGTLGVERALWGVGESSSQANVGFGLYFFTDDCLRCWVNGGNASFRTTAKYRDTSAWYHVVLKSSTVSPYFNLYVNGEEITSFTYDQRTTYPGTNNTEMNQANTVHYVGGWKNGNYYALAGYLAEVHFIDGTALTASAFGETGDYGEWKPKQVSGLTYGTNGYYLPFKQDYTVEGFSAVTYRGDGADQYVGGVGFSPDLTWVKSRSTTEHNVIFDSIRGSAVHLIPNLTVTDQNAAADSDKGITSFDTDGFSMTGPLARTNGSGTSYVAWNWDMGGTAKTVTAANGTVHSTTQKKMGSTGIRYDGNNELSTPHHDDFTFGTSDFTIEMWFYVDSSSHEKPLMSKGYYTLGVNGGWMARVDEWTSRHLTFSYHDSRGNAQQYLSAANVFNRNAWNHIAFVRRYGTDFKAYLNGTAVADTRSDDLANTNFLANNEDLMIGHETFYQSGNNGHFWGYLDEIRVSKTARYTANFTPSTTYFDGDSNTALLIHSNNANNYTVFPDSSSVEYNSDGSINSFIQANPTYGQSIVSYAGNGGGTVGHGLSSAPDMLIWKQRDGSDAWMVWHSGYGNNGFQQLNTTAAAVGEYSWFMGSTAPSSSIVTMGNGGTVNESGKNYIMYAFHDVTGYSKFGTYAGNATSGNTITTGFPVAWVMIKRKDGINNWSIIDNTRTPTGVSGKALLRADESAVEQSGAETEVEFTATGFKINNTQGELNGSGRNYIYAAFADKREYAYWLDQSGNNNDWTSVNLTESDISVDSPSNNFATWNPLFRYTTAVNDTYSEGNLKVEDNAGHTVAVGTIPMTSGKWYWEVYCIRTSFSGSDEYGMFDPSLNIPSSTGSTPADVGTGGYFYSGNGWTKANGSYVANPGSQDSVGAGDIIAFAYDVSAGTLKIYVNNVLQKTLTVTAQESYVPSVANSHGSYSVDYVGNFGQDSSFAGNKTAQGNQDSNEIGDFYYTPPSGFLALCTKNLPDVDVKPQEHFNTVLWTGNGSTNAISVGFKPDFVWGKDRVGTDHHHLFDIIRGTNQRLISNATSAENTESNCLNSFDTNGFTLGNNPGLNANGEAHVAWNWKAATQLTKTYTVKVVSDSGNKYRFDDFGSSAVVLELSEGGTYTFDQSDSSNSGHPLRFSSTSNGSHGGGSEYTTGVTTNGTPGNSGAYTKIVVPASAPTLYYYCTAHSGMGGQANTPTTNSFSNFSGTIQSNVSANADAGFSIINYQGNQTAGATVGHGLSKAPEMLIIKNRDTAGYGWLVGHASRTFEKYSVLNTTGAEADQTSIFNDTAPTSTVFSLGSDTFGNKTGDDHICYAFASVDGYSKVGSYVGNGNADGTFVYTGFKPMMVISKYIGAENWNIIDTKRSTYNVMEDLLKPDNNNAEIDTQIDIDFLSNGFKPRIASGFLNGNGHTIIYIAFAETPFKYSNAR